MMQIILYDNWLEAATKKVWDTEKKNVPRMSKMQIKQLLQLCATAEKTEFLSNGTLYQIK